MKTNIALFVLCFLCSSILYSQEAPKVKFEKISDEELSMAVYEPDTTAEAVILYDEGSSYVKYDVTEEQFKLHFSRFVRLKILKQTGTDWGNFRILNYSYNQNKEEIQGIKGITFNLENGKTIKTELKKESISKERENKYYEMIRIAFPSVKVGSVIDLKYEIISTLLWNLQEWKFQYGIPVKWSQYKVTYPEYFNYNHSSLGYHRLLVQNMETKSDNINITSNVRSSAGGFSPVQSEFVQNKITYIANIFNYAAKEVPAIEEEPYLTSIENYTTKVKFELASTNFIQVGGQFKSYTNSWKDVVNQLIDNEDFGGMIKNTRQAKETVDMLTKNISTEKQKLQTIYSYVQQNIKWDESLTLWPSKSVKKILDDKSGNSADINLLLNAMLLEAGIESDPVILSTRSNGIISPAHASLTDCNYLITRALIDSKPILLDATEPNLALGILPLRCLNGEGTLVKRDETENIVLQNPISEKRTMATLEFKDGTFSGSVLTKRFGPAAFGFREAVKESGGEKEFFDQLKGKSSGLKYDAISLVDLDSINKPVVIKYSVLITGDGEEVADFLYVNPIIEGKLDENPFTTPKRDYPVDYGNTFNEYYQISIVIPEGYVVEEIPQNISLTLEDKSVRFICQTGQIGNSVMLNYKFLVEKPLFIPSEYESLKNIYDQMILKQSEQIVFKKI